MNRALESYLCCSISDLEASSVLQLCSIWEVQYENLYMFVYLYICISLTVIPLKFFPCRKVEACMRQSLTPEKSSVSLVPNIYSLIKSLARLSLSNLKELRCCQSNIGFTYWPSESNMREVERMETENVSKLSGEHGLVVLESSADEHM